MRRGLGWWIFAVALLLPGLVRAQAEDKVVGPYRVRAIVKRHENMLRNRGFTPSMLCVHSIGQSHIDAAWRWRLAQTHTKVYRTWGQALEHMERHRDFTFSGSAPQYYEWILNEHPELFARIVDMVKQGRWEFVGGMWIEPDCNMPEGESFVRQRLLGQRFYLKHFGAISELEWLLDSFGYNLNLPQFVAKSGAKYMWTSKLTWNDTTIFPFHNFWWRSPDGSQVLTHICPIVPLPSYFPYAELDRYKDTRYLLKPGVKLVANYATLPEKIKEALSTDWLNEIGVFYGVGDGGLGPRELEIQIQEGFARKGWSHFSFGRELFEHIEKCGERLPVWTDEMYLEFHRGVQTTHSWIKRANRMMEQMMRTAETLRSLTHLYGVLYPYEAFTEIWKTVLLNQFHDILPGSSIPEVYEDAKKDYARVQTAARELTQAGMNELAKKIKISPPKGHEPLLVFNPLGLVRSGLVRIAVPSGKSYQVLDPSSGEVVSQVMKQGGMSYLIFRAENMPSVGYRVYYVKPLEAPPEPAAGSTAAAPVSGDTGEPIVIPGETAEPMEPGEEPETTEPVSEPATEPATTVTPAATTTPGATPASGTTTTGATPAPAAFPSYSIQKDTVTLENELVKVIVDKRQGVITSLLDKTMNKELIKGSANKLLAFYDRPPQYSAWEITKDYLKHPIPLPRVKRLKLTAKGPLFVELLIRRELKREGKLTVFEQRVRLVKNDPVVYLDLDADYQIHDSLVKVEFNTVLHSDTVTADGPYLAVERPAHPQLPAELARWEMPCQKWIDFSSPEMGLALLNNGKYGFSLNEDGTGYRLTVIKSARYPRANPGAENVKHRYPNFLPTGFTDLGPQHAELGLLAHAGGWREAKLWEAGLSFNTPMEAVWTKPQKGKLPPELSLIGFSAESAYLGAVKRAEDDNDLVLRIIEAAGKSGTATITLAEGLTISAANETDLLELNPTALSPSGNSLTLELGPYQIKTVKLQVKK